jgi:uncharacterized membrane protein YccC
MAQIIVRESEGLNRQSLEHAVRTALAATVSVLVARLFNMPEAYWAAVTTMVVMQSTLGASFSISVLRLIGTAMGAASGGLLATSFGANVYVFGAGVVVLGVLTAILRCDQSAFRFAGITLAIVMLVSRTASPWLVAAHRFLEVSIGIVIGLLVTAVWPERPTASPLTASADSAPH